MWGGGGVGGEWGYQIKIDKFCALNIPMERNRIQDCWLGEKT